MVALIVVLGGGYGVAGYVSASTRLSTANHAVAGAVAHRQAFDDAPSTFVDQAADAASLRSDADRFVQTWSDQSATIAGDEAALASAETGVHQQEWLTLVRRGSLDTASARIAHARKALAAAHTAATEHVKEGQFLQVYADVAKDFETLAADAQASDLAGARTASSQMVTDSGRAIAMLTDPQFPSELRQLMQGLQTLAQDFVDYIDAVNANDQAKASSLMAKTNADVTSVSSVDTSSIGTKVDEYYQPYLDTYHSELSRAENG